jgi:hypothetical protein
MVHVVCPECGLPGIPIMYGYPNERGMAEVSAGRSVLGGCVIGPNMDDFTCPRHHRWRDDGQPPSGPESPETAASRLYAAGDLAGAEQAYRALLAASIEQRGERDRETRALRHALSTVLFVAGRAEESDAVYAPLRAMELEDLRARIEDRYRRAFPA